MACGPVSCGLLINSKGKHHSRAIMYRLKVISIMKIEVMKSQRGRIKNVDHYCYIDLQIHWLSEIVVATAYNKMTDYYLSQ
jgi:hypothetical protein